MKAASRKKDAHKAMHRNSTEENKKMYTSMKSKESKESGFKSDEGEKAKEAAFTALKSCPDGMLWTSERIRDR